MPVPYPAPVNTPWKKVQYIFRLKEYLRLLHNYAGYWWRNGLTQDEYDNGIDSGLIAGEPGQQFVLTDQIKAQYPYQPNIGQNAYKNFIEQEWERRFHQVEDEIHAGLHAIEINSEYDSLLDLNF